ncbi:hypothetical protein [Parageobacillus galactosidasius]|uniref:Uncharacterized protein n=1 Tax=Parageobacillus galactosidasius TaxID=883812 RepID=A0A226QQH4_9BACL|nr:hypothetical protein [Parageobacillus galactosidasius]OXB94786.1 hypothetical protein B9L23_07955 [Parageobacillus galactosidasius]
MELIQAYLDKKLQRMCVLRVKDCDEKTINEFLEQWRNTPLTVFSDQTEIEIINPCLGPIWPV